MRKRAITLLKLAFVVGAFLVSRTPQVEAGGLCFRGYQPPNCDDICCYSCVSAGLSGGYCRGPCYDYPPYCEYGYCACY